MVLALIFELFTHRYYDHNKKIRTSFFQKRHQTGLLTLYIRASHMCDIILFRIRLATIREDVEGEKEQFYSILYAFFLVYIFCIIFYGRFLFGDRLWQANQSNLRTVYLNLAFGGVFKHHGNFRHIFNEIKRLEEINLNDLCIVC